MAHGREGKAPTPVEIWDRLDRVADQLAALGLALAGAGAREGICPDELRGLSLFVEEILSEVRGIPRRGEA